MNETLYEERVTSIWTKGLFVLLTFVFAQLASQNINSEHANAWVFVALFFALLFLFYTLNYAVLIIRITTEGVHLRFGLFHRTIPLDNIAACELDDDIPPLYKYGGAGIHWYTAHGKYRASWNMLEHPRVVLRFREKAGRVAEISFSTTQPDTVVKVVRSLIAPDMAGI